MARLAVELVNPPNSLSLRRRHAALAAGLAVVITLSGPAAPFAEAFTSLYFPPSALGTFASQNITYGEASHNTSFALSLNRDARILGASMGISGVDYAYNQTLTGIPSSASSYDNFGTGLDGLGDFNADGVNDLAVGAPYGTVGSTTAGRVYVFYGNRSGVFGQSASWSYLGDPGQFIGQTLTHGDYNGDGTDDLVVGAPMHDYTTYSSENLSIFFGSAAGLAATPGLVLRGDLYNYSDWGRSLVGAIDLNNDSFGELLVGEPFYYDIQPYNCQSNSSCTTYVVGRVAIFWGSAQGIDTGNVSYLLGNQTVRLGQRLTGLGDTDGDGADEFAMADPGNYYSSAHAYVLSGEPGSRTIRWLWEATNGANRAFGSQMCGGADLTGDGIADLMISAPVYGTGLVYLFNGTGGGRYENVTTQILRPTHSGYTYTGFGMGMAIIGDTDGDGKVEVAISDLYAGYDRGYLYLFESGNVRDGADRFIAYGIYFGWAIAPLGDLQGDGFDDFAVSDVYGLNNGNYTGTVHVFPGARSSSPFDARLYVGAEPVWSRPGALLGPEQALNLGPSMQNYLVAHRAEADAIGNVSIPLSLNFTVAGLITVDWLMVNYTIVPVPVGVAVQRAVGRDGLVVTWDISPLSQGDRFNVWSNKTGQWQPLASVDAKYRTFLDVGVEQGVDYCYYVTTADTQANEESAPSLSACSRLPYPYPPPIPQDVAALSLPDGTAIQVTWSAVPLAAGYEIWRQEGRTGVPEHLMDIAMGQLGAEDSSAQPAMEYGYRLRAVDGEGRSSSLSAPAFAHLIYGVRPPSPTNLTATADPGGHAVTLAWTAPVTFDSLTFYVLYSVSTAPGVTVEKGPMRETSFVLDGLSPGVPTTAYIVAQDGSGARSAPSPAVSFQLVDRAAPRAPAGLAAAPDPSGGAIALWWSPSLDADVVAYRIYVIDLYNSNDYVLLAEVGASATFFVHSGLRNHVTYTYMVTAVDVSSNESPGSASVTVAPERAGAPPAPSLGPLPKLTAQSRLEVSGLTEPGMRAEVWVNGLVQAARDADMAGRFTVTITLRPGDNSVMARAVDLSPLLAPEWKASPFAALQHVFLDAEPPQVAWTLPLDHADDADAQGSIFIAFTEALMPGSVVVVLRDEEGLQVASHLTWDDLHQTVTATPDEPLAHLSYYSVEVRAKDLAGNSLDFFSYSFRVGQAPPNGSPAGATGPSAIELAALVGSLAAAAVGIAFLVRRRRRPRVPVPAAVEVTP